MSLEQPEQLPPIAAIDVGTNSVHLMIAKLDSQGHFTILDSDKVVLRLGEALSPNRSFSPEAIERTMATIRRMKGIAEAYQPIYRAVATYATRMARNHHVLFQAIYEATGIQVALIDGIEEARLMALGMQSGLPLANKTFLGIDIGGGSTEIIVCQNEQIHYVNSLHLGAVILSQRHLKGKTIKRSHIKELEKEVALALAPLSSELAKHPFDCAVVCSGSAKTLAAMHALALHKEKLNDPNGYQLAQAELYHLNEAIQSLRSPAKIRERWHLESNRAEIILAGASILSMLTRFFGTKTWLVSSYGLREGLVIDTLSRLQSKQQGHQPSHSDVRWKNVLSLGERYQIDLAQAERVMQLALNLYEQLLTRPEQSSKAAESPGEVRLSEREILRAAAWLHECGKFINLSRYHRHSYYLIIHSQWMGYAQKERSLIGLVARFQRKGQAQAKNHECRDLQQRDLQRINYLASILRVAVAANRSRQGLLTGIELRWQDKELWFVIKGKDGLLPELDGMKVRKEKKALEALLDLPILLKQDEAGQAF